MTLDCQSGKNVRKMFFFRSGNFGKDMKSVEKSGNLKNNCYGSLQKIQYILILFKGKRRTFWR